MEKNEGCRVRILDELSVEIQREGHTLMNPLKWAISNNWSGERVEFCGYTIPHPSDELAHISIQFEDESMQTASHLLAKICEGLDSIETCCTSLLSQLDRL